MFHSVILLKNLIFLTILASAKRSVLLTCLGKLTEINNLSLMANSFGEKQMLKTSLPSLLSERL